MPSREDILRDETYKGDVDELSTRIFYTLTSKPGKEMPEASKVHRTAKLLALLMENLSEQGILTDDIIDDMLIDVTS